MVLFLIGKYFHHTGGTFLSVLTVTLSAYFVKKKVANMAASDECVLCWRLQPVLISCLMFTVTNNVCLKPHGHFWLFTSYKFGTTTLMFTARSVETERANPTTNSVSSQPNEAIKVPKHEFIKQHWLVQQQQNVNNLTIINRGEQIPDTGSSWPQNLFGGSSVCNLLHFTILAPEFWGVSYTFVTSVHSWWKGKDITTCGFCLSPQ